MNTGEGTNDEMCIAILQYYPKQAQASDHCWGFLHNDDATLTICADDLV